MPKPPNTKPISPETRGAIQRYKETHRDPLPHDPALLRAIVQVLVKVLEPDSRKARILRNRLHKLAAFDERHRIHGHRFGLTRLFDNFTDADREASFYPKALSLLASKLPRRGHDPGIIHLQQSLLSDYLTEKGIFSMKSRANRQKWLNDHRAEIRDEVAVLGCNCDYPNPLPDIHLDTTSNKDTLVRILRVVHSLQSDEAVRHLLKPPGKRKHH